MPSSPITVERLRLETLVLHDSIEASITILRAHATAASYRVYLAALLGFHAPFEKRLRQIPAVRTLPIDQRWKVPALRPIFNPFWDDEAGRSGSAESE